MKWLPPVSSAAVGIAMTAATLAGCAAPGRSTQAASGTSAVSSGTAASGTPSRSGTRALTPRQRAETDVKAILAAFVPPPGARRLAKAPAGGSLNQPVTSLVDATQADGTTFWEAPGGPLPLLSWEIAHVPHRFALGDADFGPPTWDRAFDLPPVPGVLTSREMVVEVTGLGDGETGIRVDAEVGWQPARTASDRVSAAAGAVTIAEFSHFGATRPVRQPVTVTSPAVVKRLAALVNGLAISPFNGSAASCPSPFTSYLELTFRAAPAGEPLATFKTSQPCGVADFSARPGQNLALTQPASLNRRLLTIAGLHWKLT